MTSDRHIFSSTERTDAYLDAARACLLDVGWRRTTLTDVARRASVSRMTIYRAWPDMQTLLADLMTREWQRMMSEAIDAAPTAAGIADAMLDSIRALRANDLFQRILDVDPELIVPYLLVRRGRSQQGIIDLLAIAIQAGQEEHAIRAGDPATIARTLVLAAHGITLSAHTMTDGQVTLADLDEEFHSFARTGLAP